MGNLILIGMPSSGKSTVGLRLANALGYGFIDSDLLIREREGRTLSEIIASVGAEEFIKIEERVNTGLHCKNCVIATGGSAVYSQNAMLHFKRSGTLVYLKIKEADVERRVGDLTGRGVVMRGDIKTVRELYEQRVPLYEKYADFTVDREGKDVNATVNEILTTVHSSRPIS